MQAHPFLGFYICPIDSLFRFYLAASMQGSLSHERNVRLSVLSVRPSVCLSVKRVHCDKTKETGADVLIAHERPSILVFLARRMVGGDDHFYPKLCSN